MRIGYNLHSKPAPRGKSLKLSDRPVIGIVGMPGSGKSTAAKVGVERGYSVVVMGDFVRAEAARRRLDPNPSNLRWLMFEMRREQGKAAVAKLTVKGIEELKVGGGVMIDGVRSLEEVEEFKLRFPGFKLLAIHASPEVRFKRLFRRERSDDPKSWEEFRKRDLKELDIGIGDAIAMADTVVVSEGSVEETRRRVKIILGRFTDESPPKGPG